MSNDTNKPEAKPDDKVPPETLELRARPQPITRINRKVLIGGAAVVLLVISGLVLVGVVCGRLERSSRPTSPSAS